MVIMLCCGEARAQHLAIKTNALMDVALVPNVGLEMVTGEHSSVEVSVFGSHMPYGQHCTMLGIQPEYRFWFNGRPMIREYVGITALFTTYDISLGKPVYTGDAAGLGITGGYAFMISKRWNLELSGGFGALMFHQKQYHADDNYDADDGYEPEEHVDGAEEDLRTQRFMYRWKRIPVLGKLPFDPVTVLVLSSFVLLLVWKPQRRGRPCFISICEVRQ